MPRRPRARRKSRPRIRPREPRTEDRRRPEDRRRRDHDRDRAALARAFVAKAVIGLPTTSMLIERLTVDKQLRRLCGWERPGELSSEATFSRAFAEFALSELPSRLHEALIKRTHEDRLVGHISRDATAIEAGLGGRYREADVDQGPPIATEYARWLSMTTSTSLSLPMLIVGRVQKP